MLSGGNPGLNNLTRQVSRPPLPAANDRTLCHIEGYGSGMADQEDWTPGDVASMVANPF